MSLKLIQYIFSFLKSIIKPIYWFIVDLWDVLKGRDKLIPPRSMIFVGDGDYKKIGDEFFMYFKELGGLKPDEKILDVGCGIGRMTIPLTKYLSKNGEYYGFDIVKKGIDWCNKNISSIYPNFFFKHADIYNKMYNPNGSLQSLNYIFPYNNEKFDFIFLTSVFTHMFRKDVEHYVNEISRVMKTGGRCLITFFLLNEESDVLIKKGISTQRFIYQIDGNSFTVNEKTPEKAICFNEKYIIELFIANSLSIKERIHYGSWCGRKRYKSYQDIIIAEKH